MRHVKRKKKLKLLDSYFLVGVDPTCLKGRRRVGRKDHDDAMMVWYGMTREP